MCPFLKIIKDIKSSISAIYFYANYASLVAIAIEIPPFVLSTAQSLIAFILTFIFVSLAKKRKKLHSTLRL